MGMAPWLFGLFVLLQIWIALMLSVQSAVLIKLLPEIKKTASNSDFFTKKLKPKSHLSQLENLVDNVKVENNQEDSIFPNCKFKNDAMHIHNAACQ